MRIRIEIEMSMEVDHWTFNLMSKASNSSNPRRATFRRASLSPINPELRVAPNHRFVPSLLLSEIAIIAERTSSKPA
jgi:hypothetical protein